MVGCWWKGGRVRGASKNDDEVNCDPWQIMVWGGGRQELLLLEAACVSPSTGEKEEESQGLYLSRRCPSPSLAHA